MTILYCRAEGCRRMAAVRQVHTGTQPPHHEWVHFLCRDHAEEWERTFSPLFKVTSQPLTVRGEHDDDAKEA